MALELMKLHFLRERWGFLTQKEVDHEIHGFFSWPNRFAVF
jgi:hypothetical protein